MQRRNSLLKRSPLPLMIANEALLTLPRDPKRSPPIPLSNRISYSGSLPRHLTAVSEQPSLLPMADYYTATRGRPVATSGTQSATVKKRLAPAIPKKPDRSSFPQVVTAPASQLLSERLLLRIIYLLIFIEFDQIFTMSSLYFIVLNPMYFLNSSLILH